MINYGFFTLFIHCLFFLFYFILSYFFQVRDLPQCEKTLLGHVQTGFVFELKPEFLNVSAQKLKLFWLSMQSSHLCL